MRVFVYSVLSALLFLDIEAELDVREQQHDLINNPLEIYENECIDWGELEYSCPEEEKERILYSLEAPRLSDFRSSRSHPR